MPLSLSLGVLDCTVLYRTLALSLQPTLPPYVALFVRPYLTNETQAGTAQSICASPGRGPKSPQTLPPFLSFVPLCWYLLFSSSPCSCFCEPLSVFLSVGSSCAMNFAWLALGWEISVPTGLRQFPVSRETEVRETGSPTGGFPRIDPLFHVSSWLVILRATSLSVHTCLLALFLRQQEVNSGFVKPGVKRLFLLRHSALLEKQQIKWWP